MSDLFVEHFNHLMAGIITSILYVSKIFHMYGLYPQIKKKKKNTRQNAKMKNKKKH